MRILHVTIGLPPTISGGLPIYVDSLATTEQEQGNDIYILQPGSIGLGSVKIKKEKNSKFKVFSIKNALPVSSIFGIVGPENYMKSCDKNVYLEFLKKYKFDIIHIHSIMGIHKEFFEAARELKVKMIMTTHDYFGLCLKTNFIDRNGKLCENSESLKCSKCNFNCGLSKKKAMVMQSSLYKKMKNSYLLKKIRKKVRNDVVSSDSSVDITFECAKQYDDLIMYYHEIFRLIDFFHFNSEISKKIYEINLGKIKGKVVPITLSNIIDNRKIKDFNHELKIGYIGRTESYKGINLLIDSLRKMEEKRVGFKCYLYGDDFSAVSSENIINCGKYNRAELNKIFDSIDVLVVPSIWYETFGLITLEALSYGVPVIVSNMVGSKMLIEAYDENNIVKTNSDELANLLISYSKNKKKLESYNKWIVNEFKFVNNENHTSEMLKLYEKVK